MQEYLIVLTKLSALRYSLTILLCIVVASGDKSSADDWVAPYYRDHSLTGKIYSLHSGDWITSQQLHAAIRQSNVLLLGETHTNPDHHLGQAALIHQWLDAARPAVIVMEMLAVKQWQFDQKRWSSLSELHASVQASAGNWEWEIYDPILRIAVQHQLPIQAANLTKAQRRQFSSQQVCQVTQDGKSLRFCDTLKMTQKKAIEDLILDAHCGYLHREQVSPLVHTQIARDASFALSLYRAGIENKVVLIAGAVHVRKDIGVPRHLRRIGIPSLSVAFVPVSPNKVTPVDYFDQNLGRPFDYIVFTPSDRNTDPCVEFAEQLKNMQH